MSEPMKGTASSPARGPARGPAIHASQLGYLCDSRKRITLAAEGAAGAAGFEIQDMSRIDAQALDGRESWKTVVRGPLSAHAGPMGAHLVGDFSDLRAPGVYRAALAGRAGFSYPFVISDGAFSRLPSLFLDYVHSRRCGDFEDELRGPCHLDDGRRSDTGELVDAAGGWHDAGDLRKWMATTTLPILSFFELRSRLAFSRNNWRERPHEDDLLAEAAWGLRWILKMQDSATGMFFEDVGGGGEARREPGASWWSENHAGCYAD
ncbi:MAG: glycoside hydrolase family 9 protein, partial [Spirochaetes bacterium]|nr:glycoside hydrolase family 9 protein [Spirochaetota bacterium]